MKPCNQCGKCCIQYSDGGLTATKREIEYWQEYYPEIFKFVKDGNIWMDPHSGQQLVLCPWFNKETNKNIYSCRIYQQRPDDCRHYPVTITEMIRDECEMIEISDLNRPKRAQRLLDRMMADSRPPVEN